MMYKKVKNQFDSFDIFEIPTEIMIKQNLSNDVANKLCRNLNLGGGFDGFTPDFFMNRLEVNKDY